MGKLTDIEKGQIDLLHREGLGYRTIAQRINRSVSSVRAVLRDVRTGPTAVKARTKWTDAENEAFTNGWNPALTPSENARRIAEQIGRHPDGVISKAKMVGLIQNTSSDPYRPTPERAAKHAAACLREGGFPAAYLINGQTIVVRPCDLEQAA